MALAVIRQRRSHHKKNVSLILNKRWVKDLSSGIVIQGMNDKENRYDTINVNTSERNEKGKPEEITVEEVVIENMQKESTTVAKEPNSLLKELALLREERQRKASQNNNEEKDNKPYSDEQISLLFKQRGVNVARRTVAKYREMMNIPSSAERKRLMRLNKVMNIKTN